MSIKVGFKCFYICFVLCVVFLSPAGNSEANGTKNILDTLKNSTREEIAKLVCSYGKKDISIDDILIFSSLLDNKETIFDKPDLISAIQVRDVALLCIEEIAGTTFFPRPRKGKIYPVKGIISYLPKDGDICRLSIVLLSDDQFEVVKAHIEYWIEGYKAGCKVRQKGS